MPADMVTDAPRGDGAQRILRRWTAGARRASLVLIAATGASGVLTVPAAADPAPDVAQAVASVRGAAPCGPLRYDPRVEHAAEIINRSTYDYLQHTAQNVPADDPHPTAIVKDLGIEGTKSYSLQGASQNLGDAIKGALLEGYNVIPDCGYTEFGTSLLQEPDTGYFLVVVVLVGP
jgi:hypothetical protein